MRAKTTENNFHFHFHFKWNATKENRRKRESERKREREKERRDRDITGTAPIARSFNRDRDRAMCQSRSREAPTAQITIARSADSADRDYAKRRSRSHEAPTTISPSRRLRSRLRADRDRAKCPDLMIFFFWVLFVFWGMNDIIYSFGNRENVRKCEQQVENVFSMVFSRTQPNIRKYFLKHLLKCNQTHENIFLSGK